MKDDKNICKLEVGCESRCSSIATTLGYNEDGKLWYVYRIPHLTISSKHFFEDVGIQVYLPTYFQKKIIKGKTIRVEKLKILNYLFALADREQVKSLIALDHIHPMYRHRCDGEILKERDIWQTIPPKQMHSLMIAAQSYEQEMEFCIPEGMGLERGDRVRVVAGPNKDVEGIFLHGQGDKRGRVYIALTKKIGTMTTLMDEKWLKVLEFSRQTNHFFRKIQATERLLEKAIMQYADGGNLDDDVANALNSFLFRYSELNGLSHVNFAKLTACRYAAMMLLGRQNDARKCIGEFLKEMESDKNSRRAIKRWPTARKYIDKWIKSVEAVIQPMT